MWPKMLFEILPHVGRLVPVAERFFATRSERDREEQAALTTISETLRTELGRLSDATEVTRQAVATQGDRINGIAADVARARAAVESLEARLGRLEDGISSAQDAAERAGQAATRIATLCIVLVVLAVIIAGLLGYLLLHSGGR